MNIGLDCDGVLSNFHYSFSIIANKLFGTPIIENINEVRAYDWPDWGYPLNKQQHNLVWREIDRNAKDFWLDMNPLVDKNVFDRIKKLEENNHSIFFITSRRNTAGDNVLKQTFNWIQKYFNLEYFSIIPTEKKGIVLERLKIDFFLDDMPENLIEATIEAPKCKNFLLVRPYNSYAIEFFKKSKRYRNIEIVYSVDEFLDSIEKR